MQFLSSTKTNKQGITHRNKKKVLMSEQSAAFRGHGLKCSLLGTFHLRTVTLACCMCCVNCNNMYKSNQQQWHVNNRVATRIVKTNIGKNIMYIQPLGDMHWNAAFRGHLHIWQWTVTINPCHVYYKFD